MVKLYGFWRSLASLRVRIALNLKDVGYDETSIDLIKGEQHADTYKRVNPQGVVPALDLGDGKKALFESLAIVEYLDETYPNPPLMPRTPRERARVRGLSLITVADTHPLVVPRIRGYLEHQLKIDEARRNGWLRHWFDEGSRTIETHLATDPESGRFCHGDSLTIADVCIASHWIGTEFFGADRTSFPTLARIMNECFALDAFARAHPKRQAGAPG